MNTQISIPSKQNIRDKIHLIRGMQVMLDRDLSEIYGVETKIFNQAVKRNELRFPKHFKFQLSDEEFGNLRSQIVTSSWGGRRYKPYVFTEQGVAMLSAVLKSKQAIKISIQIMEAFVQMRRLVANNALVLQRVDRLEKQQLITTSKLEHIFQAIEDKNIKPQTGIFFDGQVFDAYIFISKLIKQATKSIILIDNYIDESVLTLIFKRSKNCRAIIYSKNISKQLQLDLAKHNEQYSSIEAHEFSSSHDRFLILDEKEIYLIGASLKDLGKKWFAFSKLDKNSILEIFRRLK
ncbi:MAG: DNA-binding protein [Gammaproteobacteria bacterium RIFCSPHIGHO2_02_FULL_42_13]|nr:MAG: DNA-binding protein [Gammaproteobacteria bacterium RIFCSPHIGHO2_02_FULL_42_13]OGT68093.1 MAG: DNA-binding protein [Gammaproteobacteria bacterium RIFCSPLOWO2_02_FULL_42_9]